MNGSDPLLDDLLRGLVAGDSLAVVTEGNINHIHTLEHWSSLYQTILNFAPMCKNVVDSGSAVICVMSSVPDMTR